MTNERAAQALLRLTTIPGDGYTWDDIVEANKMGVAALRDQQEQSNEPREIIFGRGEIAVDTVAENDNAPPREIMLRKLDSPILPIGASTGGEGTSVDELNNIIVRMHFENPESVKVLIRAANIVLGTFGEQPDEPLTLDELREMDGEPVWNDTVKKYMLINLADKRMISNCGTWRPLEDTCFHRKLDIEGID